MRFAESTIPQMEKTRSLGVEVAGTDNHFRAALATKGYFMRLTLHQFKGLGFWRLWIPSRYI
jgi:hypothetical protein